MKIGILSHTLVKKSPKFHWEWGLILAPENTKKNFPWNGSMILSRSGRVRGVVMLEGIPQKFI